MITTHFVFFRKLSNAPAPTGFKGYTTIPPLFAFLRRISVAVGGGAGEGEGKALLKPIWWGRGRRR